MGPLASVNLRINGEDRSAWIDSGLPLVRYLRDELRLIGTKVGCTPGDGDCGACMVLVDGKPELACLVGMGGLEGRSVETIEGESPGAPLDVVQEAFVRSGVIHGRIHRSAPGRSENRRVGPRPGISTGGTP